jgi:hypothetical protein
MDTPKRKPATTAAFRVICLECNKRFSTRSMLPVCPSCNGSDIEVAP